MVVQVFQSESFPPQDAKNIEIIVQKEQHRLYNYPFLWYKGSQAKRIGNQWFRRLTPVVCVLLEGPGVVVIFPARPTRAVSPFIPIIRNTLMWLSTYSPFLDKPPTQCFTHRGPFFLSHSISKVAARDYLRAWSNPPASGPETPSPSRLFCLLPAYLGLFVDLGRVSLLEARAGFVWPRFDTGLDLRPHCGPEYTNVTGPRARRELRGSTERDHTAVKPVSLRNSRGFSRCIQVDGCGELWLLRV